MTYVSGCSPKVIGGPEARERGEEERPTQGLCACVEMHSKQITQDADDLGRERQVSDVCSEEHDGAGQSSHPRRHETLSQAQDRCEIQIRNGHEKPQHEQGGEAGVA